MILLDPYSLVDVFEIRVLKTKDPSLGNYFYLIEVDGYFLFHSIGVSCYFFGYM